MGKQRGGGDDQEQKRKKFCRKGAETGETLELGGACVICSTASSVGAVGHGSR